MHTYTFTYYGWIPGYNDFDQEWFDVEANTLEEAWDKVNGQKIFGIKSGPALAAIDGESINSLNIKL